MGRGGTFAIILGIGHRMTTGVDPVGDKTFPQSLFKSGMFHLLSKPCNYSSYCSLGSKRERCWVKHDSGGGIFAIFCELIDSSGGRPLFNDEYFSLVSFL